MLDLTYDQLDEKEKVALTVAMSFPYSTLRSILPKLFRFSANESTYYRYHNEGQEKLREKGVLDGDGFPTNLAFSIIPLDVMKQMLTNLRREVKLLDEDRHKQAESLDVCQRKCRDLEEHYKVLDIENAKIKSEIEKLHEIRNAFEKFDFTLQYQRIKSYLSDPLQARIENAITRFKDDDYDSAIVKAYVVSEALARNLFRSLYGDDLAEKVQKHEARLKKMWTDEQIEKHEHPGIQLITSLFSVILWYRNKMGAHSELKPNIEAARLSLEAVLQSLSEVQRLGFEAILKTVT